MGVRDLLCGAAFITRAVLSDALTLMGSYVRPEPVREPEWVTEIRKDVEASASIPAGARESAVSYSPVAKRMIHAGMISEMINEIETPIGPLRGSRAWRERHGDSR